MTEAEFNDIVVDLVDGLIEIQGADVRSITIYVQASGEYPYSIDNPLETLPVAGLASADA